MRLEVGLKECFGKKLVMSWLTWAGHVEILGDENKITKTPAVLGLQIKGGEEDRECDEGSALRDVWKEYEGNGERQLNIDDGSNRG